MLFDNLERCNTQMFFLADVTIVSAVLWPSY